MLPPHEDDFTERGYRQALEAAIARYRFETFGTAYEGPHVLWRHDVDLSVHRAVRLAELEHDLGVASTYFLLFHSEFYNLLERAVTERARRLPALGHAVGLHFDSAFYGEIDSLAELAERVAAEAALLGDLLETPIGAFSFHNPSMVNDDLAVFADDEIGGLLNVYGRSIRERYHYASDANGLWRHDRLHDVLASGEHYRLHVLTHPGWWQAEAMPPRARVARSVQGRAEATLRSYDDLLARHGRPNVA